MQEFIAAKREQIADLCRTHHVKRLSVFGSAVRDDFDPSRSDVDIIVEFEQCRSISTSITNILCGSPGVRFPARH